MHRILTSSAKALRLPVLVNRLLAVLTSPWEPWVYCSAFDHNDERRVRL